MPYYTYEDYCRWEGNWELIDGIPYAMTPQPRPEHQAIAGNLHAELRASLKKAGCNCKVYQPIDYKISEVTVLNPDVSVLCQPPTGAFIDFPPALVAEVLSPSTALKDRHTKFQLYQQAGIPYYLLVDTDKKEVEIYKQKNGQYEAQAVNPGQPFIFTINSCIFEVQFAAIWD